MRIVENMNGNVKGGISLQENDKFKTYVKSPYLRTIDCDGGLLSYNTLTGELVHFSEEEYNSPGPELMNWLITHWFYFPSDTSPKAIADMTKQAVRARRNITSSKNPKDSNSYVVLTTTDCNARCYYCYEATYRHIPMSDKVALDVAKYITKNATGKVHISWFGGEPLCNPKAIRIICEHLTKNGIEYTSSMISNGYLLNQFSADEIKDLWHLTNIQITLDGTKEVYQYSKNYKNEDPNAYERVLDNIEYAMNSGVQVSIRMNVSLSNCEDLLDLVGMLHNRFHQYGDKLYIYANALFIGEGDPPLELTEEETDILYNNVIRVFSLIDSLNISYKMHDISNIPMNHCMADSGRCKVITPDGNLTPCEHHTDDEICGNIYEGVTDHDLLDTWFEYIKSSRPECETCFNYPKCVMIKKCPTDCICEAPQKRLMEYKIDSTMLKLYNLSKENINNSDTNKGKREMVDIIIPAYNAHEHLENCLNSIVAQTYKNFYVTIVNDGGKDYSNIIEKFRNLMNIREIGYESNQGTGNARQYGFDRTTSDFVTFVDADDILMSPFALEYLVNGIKMDDGYAACVGDFAEENEEGGLVVHNQDTTWIFAKLYRRSFINKHKIRFCPNSRWNEDSGWNMCVKLCSSSEPNEGINFISDVLYCWKNNPNSITKIDNFRYTYDKSFVGLVENMIWAFSLGYRNAQFKDYVTDSSFLTFMNLYQYFIEAHDRDNRFLKQSWAWLQAYYDFLIRPIKDAFTKEAVTFCYSEAMTSAYMRGSMVGIVPFISVSEFLRKLENHEEIEYSDEDISDYFPEDSSWIVMRDEEV